ncbi:MAG: hypothetical protein HY813_03670 [Candidatus Portnoybacteria bacterium]|nr:hypothetical protein [Candidatus Portnoybacteria bacterium]
MKKRNILVLFLIACICFGYCVKNVGATAIVGIVQDGRVWIGGDCRALSGYEITDYVQKVFKSEDGRFIIGFAGLLKSGQVLQYFLEVPPQNDNQTVFEFMVKTFVPAMQKSLSEKGANANTIEILVGYKSQLFLIDSESIVIEATHRGFSAIGSGRSYCLGSLCATSGKEMGPEQRIKMALEAATRFSAAVAAPFDILTLP